MTAEIGFYHLSRSRLDQALGQLLARSLSAGQRAVIRCRDAAQLQSLNAALWKLDDSPWLPHGSKAQGQGEQQPIWLTLDHDVPNGARFLFLMAGVETDDAMVFERVFVVFDGSDEIAVNWAREKWRGWAAEDLPLSYWQQTEDGWKKQADTRQKT